MASLRMGAAVMAMNLNDRGSDVPGMLQLSGTGIDKVESSHIRCAHPL